MRRWVIIFCFLSVVVLLFLVLFSLSPIRIPAAPRFIPAENEPQIESYQLLEYDSSSESPFAGDTVWLYVSPARTYVQYYLFDLRTRKVLGELLNAAPVFTSPDRSKLLCSHREFEGGTALRDKLVGFLDRISFHKFRLSSHPREMEALWLLDLKRHTVKCLGRIFLRPMSTLSFQTSPDFRYTFVAIRDFRPQEFFICDLGKKRLTVARVPGGPLTWWDNQSVVLETAANSFILYHVPTATVSNLLDSAVLDTYLAGLNDREATAANAVMYSAGSGRERKLFLSVDHVKSPDRNSYLLRLLPSSNNLQLLSSNCAPYLPKRIDATETWQVFGRLTSDFLSGQVCLRDLRTGETRTLVPAEGSSEPAFYNDTVIYLRDNCLWQIDLNGSNNTRLFPPQ